MESSTPPKSLQGWKPSLGTWEEKCQAVAAAMDYRGDVALTLLNDEQVVGYVFNRHEVGDESYLEAYLAGEVAARRIHYRELVAIDFTGKDQAAGKSWAMWLERVAHAQQNGSIAELYPEELEE